ncbi:MAG TPA: hypothetical protein VNG93_04030 [Candidatus Dormibacteraeota bacterium]|nr:hypothetical protein [Candidatus Dormibacteraeota bacterium]
MRRLRLGPMLGATVAGLVGGAVFASVLLLVVTPSAGPTYWAAVAIATAVSLGAALGSQVVGALQPPPPAEEGMTYALSFSAAPPGGLMPTAEAMVRFDEELRLAAEYGRPLCVALVGLDPAEGVEATDALEALRQLSAGAVRKQDVVTDRGSAEVLLMLLETTYSAGWVVMERIHHRVSAVGVGALRCVLVAPGETDTLREVLDELDSGLEACRDMDVHFADPTKLLAPAR